MDLKREIYSATDYIDPCKEGVACKHLPGNKSSGELMFIREQVSGGGDGGGSAPQINPLISPGRRTLAPKIFMPSKKGVHVHKLKVHVYFKDHHINFTEHLRCYD